MLAEIEKRINEENARPKKRYISPATREEVYAIYYDALRRKIEERGTRNFPESPGKKLYGELTMIVTVNDDGRVLDTEIVRGSGNITLDRRAVAIVAPPAPFGRFTPAMRKQADQLGGHLALQVHARRRPRDQAERGARDDADLGPLLRHGQPGRAQPVAVDPRRVRRADRRAGRVRARCSPAGRLRAGVRAFAAGGASGCNVTCRSSSRPPGWSRGATRAARWPAPCNMLRFDADGWLGDNTDGIGLVRDIERNAGVALGGARVLLVGAGGAAAGVLGPLIESGASEVVVANRSVARRGRAGRAASRADRARRDDGAARRRAAR